jgi:hypothetical protein
MCDDDASFLRSPSKQLRVSRFAHSDFDGCHGIKVPYTPDQAAQNVVIKILVY